MAVAVVIEEVALVVAAAEPVAAIAPGAAVQSEVEVEVGSDEVVAVAVVAEAAAVEEVEGVGVVRVDVVAVVGVREGVELFGAVAAEPVPELGHSEPLQCPAWKAGVSWPEPAVRGLEDLGCLLEGQCFASSSVGASAAGVDAVAVVAVADVDAPPTVAECLVECLVFEGVLAAFREVED